MRPKVAQAFLACGGWEIKTKDSATRETQRFHAGTLVNAGGPWTADAPLSAGDFPVGAIEWQDHQEIRPHG